MNVNGKNDNDVENNTGEARRVKNLHKMGDLSIRSKISSPLKKKLLLESEKDLVGNSNNSYQPLTTESKKAYALFLDLVSKNLPDVSEEVLLDTAQEILAILKLKNISKIEKEKEINIVLKLTKEKFSQLFDLSLEIEDFFIKTDKTEKTKKNEEITVLNIGDEKSEKSENFEEEIIEQIEIEEDLKEEEKSELEFLEKFTDRDYLINLIKQDITDDIKAREIEQNILNILGIEDEIECQNKLMEISEDLDFELVRKIFDERNFIYFGFYLKINKKNEHKIKTIISQIMQNEKLYQQLAPLLKLYQSDLLINRIFESENQNDNFWQNLSNLEINEISKKIISFTKKERFLSFVTNTLKLPRNSKKIKHEGYEEITIPSSIPGKDMERNIKIKDLPEWCHPIFQEIKELNPIQSKTFATSFNSEKNLLVCAPTGAGKTIVALLTILGLFEKSKKSNNEINFEKIKVIYIAPMKALVSEIVSTFKKRLACLNINICEFTGDVHLTSSEFEQNTIIVSTPEKWDVVSRKASEKIILDNVKLVIIDEVHLLGDFRGAVIEGNVIRLKKWCEANNKIIRILGLSATLPNYHDVARFLEVEENSVFYFGNEFRPVPLEQNYIGISENKGFKQMMLIKEILYKKVIERVKQQQILIFVHSRKETISTAFDLKEKAFSEDKLDFFLEKNSNSEKIINSMLGDFDNKDLSDLVKIGIGVHHAGLSRRDRHLMEDLFAGKHLSVLISTATLAWGVNLPARTVIIKNTQVYSAELGKWTELNIQDIMQMLGRAGRPLYDITGEGIIITSNSMVKNYLSYLNEQMPIESYLNEKILDHFNAAIVSGDVTNFKEAIDWFQKSYFYIRLKANPSFYGFQLVDKNNLNFELFRFLLDFIYTCLIDLEKYGLIIFNKQLGVFEKTNLGKICSYFYIKPTSMQIYRLKIIDCVNTIDIFHLFTLSSEFQYITIREEERVELQKLIHSVPIPVKTTSEDPLSKINILLQCYISKIPIEGYSVNADMIYISQNAQRILRALFSLSIELNLGSCGKFLEICLMVEKRCWGVLTPLRQFPIDSAVIRKIEQQEHLTWEHFLLMTENQLYNIIKNEEETKKVDKYLKNFPRFESELLAQPIDRNYIEIEINLKKNFKWNSSLHGNYQFLWIFILDTDQEKLLYYQPVIFYKECEELVTKCRIFIEDNFGPVYYVKIYNDKWLNSFYTLPLFFEKMIPVAKFPPPTELQEIKENVLEKDFLEKYSDLLETDKFNPIQSEVFPFIYTSFESIFLGALEGSDTLKLSFCSIIRLYEEDLSKRSKTVVLFEESIINDEVRILNKIAEYFGISLSTLEGDLQEDIKKLNTNNIIISTVKDFDQVSRNFKKRPGLKDIRLFICTDLHKMGLENSKYEVLLSKMQLFFNLTNQKTRFILLSRSIANFDSICEWMKIQPKFAFNYSPSLRKNDIDTIFIGFDKINSNECLDIMTHKLISLMKMKNVRDKKILVFVENKQCARILISKILKSFISNKIELVENEELKNLLEETAKNVKDVYLSNFLSFGAAYISSSISDLEKTTLLELFAITAIKLLVVAKEEKKTLKNVVSDILVIFDTDDFRVLEISEAMQCLNCEEEEESKKKLIIMTKEWRKECLRYELFENYSLESNLNKNLIDYLNQEIASIVVANKQECIDWLTWTFFYKRLIKNPNYYFLNSIATEDINQYLSDLIDSVVDDLKKIGFVESEENEENFESSNAGIICAFYDVKVLTVYNFFQTLQKNISIDDIFELFSEQPDFNLFKIENKSIEKKLKNLYQYCKFKTNKLNVFSPSFKIFVLIQTYLSRLEVNFDFKYEIIQIVKIFLNLLLVLIDCAASENKLKESILCMKMSQMLIQRLWNDNSQLLQLPFFDQETLQKCEDIGIKDLDDFFELEDNEREFLLKKFKQKEIEKIAEFANRFPSVNLKFKFGEDSVFEEGDNISFEVYIERENLEENEKLSFVNSNGFLDNRKEQWWLLVADPKQNIVLHIRRIYFEKEYNKKVNFVASKVGNFELSIMLVCDSYLGCDVVNKGPTISIKETSDND